MRKGLSNVIVTGSVLFVLLVVVSGLAVAQMVSFPMRLDGSVNGLSGSSCHVQIYNGSGVAADFSSGSSFSNVKINGNPGDHITFMIDGRSARVNGGSYITFQSAGYASITLTYPAIQTATPTANQNNGGNSGGYPGSAGGQYTYITPTPTSTANNSSTGTVTITPTVAPTPTPTPTVPTPSATPVPEQSGGFPWWLIALLIAIIVIAGGAIYYVFLRK